MTLRLQLAAPAARKQRCCSGRRVAITLFASASCNLRPLPTATCLERAAIIRTADLPACRPSFPAQITAVRLDLGSCYFLPPLGCAPSSHSGTLLAWHGMVVWPSGRVRRGVGLLHSLAGKVWRRRRRVRPDITAVANRLSHGRRKINPAADCHKQGVSGVCHSFRHLPSAL